MLHSMKNFEQYNKGVFYKVQWKFVQFVDIEEKGHNFLGTCL